MGFTEIGKEFHRLYLNLSVGGKDVFGECTAARYGEAVARHRSYITIVRRGEHGESVHANRNAASLGFIGKGFNLFGSLRETRCVQVEMTPTLEYVAYVYQIEIARIGIIERIIEQTAFVEHIGRILIGSGLYPLTVNHRVRQTFLQFYLLNHLQSFSRWRCK